MGSETSTIASPNPIAISTELESFPSSSLGNTTGTAQTGQIRENQTFEQVHDVALLSEDVDNTTPEIRVTPPSPSPLNGEEQEQQQLEQNESSETESNFSEAELVRLLFYGESTFNEIEREAEVEGSNPSVFGTTEVNDAGTDWLAEVEGNNPSVFRTTEVNDAGTAWLAKVEENNQSVFGTTEVNDAGTDWLAEVEGNNPSVFGATAVNDAGTDWLADVEGNNPSVFGTTGVNDAGTDWLAEVEENNQRIFGTTDLNDAGTDWLAEMNDGCNWASEMENEETKSETENQIKSGGQDGISNSSKKNEKKASVRFYDLTEVRMNGKLIGEGGFSRVLGGFLHGTPVAIKLFHTPIDLTKVQAELNLLMSLKHRCLVGIYGVVSQTEEIDCPQLILQNFSEGNVLQFLNFKDNPADNGTLGKFAYDVIEGCQYLHQKGIIHGNLAARNILVEKLIARNKIFYNAKVSDMGLIRFAEPTGGNYMKIPGTDRVVPIRWVPKEIIEEKEDGTVGQDFTFQSDLWMYGVLLWEMWARALPYGSSYSNLKVMQLIKDGYSPLKLHRPSECPPQVVSVMETVFQEPANRSSFQELYNSNLKVYRGFGIGFPKVSKKVKNGGKLDKNDSIAASDSAYLPVSENEPFKEKGEKKKRRKNGGKNKAKSAEGSGSTVSFNAAGASRLGPRLTGPQPRTEANDESSNVPQSQVDPEQEIAKLLMRVNQLESERMARGVGRGGILNREHWQRRLGPPQYQRRSYNEYEEDDGTRFSGPPPRHNSLNSGPHPSAAHLQQTQSSAQLPPPPPYSETPLPNHSSTFLSHEIPGPSRGYEGYAPRRGRGANRPGGSRVNSNEHGGEDFIRKIRRLAEEIEVLRAEKMTQELLKKSAELADLMKYMSVGGATAAPPRPRIDRRGSYEVDNHASNSHNRGPLPQPFRDAPYDEYSQGQGSNGYGRYLGGYGPRWEGNQGYGNGREYYGRVSQSVSRGTPYNTRGIGKNGRGFGKFGGGGNPRYGGGPPDYYDQGPYGGQM